MTDRGIATALNRARRIFLLCHFLRWLPSGLLLPIMVLVLTQRGLGLTQVGYVFAVYGGVTSLLELPTGGLADALGRKPVLLIATVFDVGLTLGLLFGQQPWHFMTAAAAGAVGRALLSGPLESWYVDTARAIDPAVVLRPALSGAGIMESTAIGVGALLSALLPTLASGLPLDGVISLLTVPLLAGLVAEGVSLGAVAVLLHEPRPAGVSTGALRTAISQVPGVVRSGARLAVAGRDLRLVFGATFLLVVGLVSVEALWQPRFADLLGGIDVGVRTNGYVIVGMSLATAAGSWLANHLPNPVADHPPRAAGAALLLAAIAMAGLAVTDGFPTAVATYLAVYAGVAAAGVLRAELLHERVPSERRATMLSTLSLSQQGGNLVSSLLLARLADTAGIPTAWLVGALTVAAASGLMIAIRQTPTPVSSSSSIEQTERADR